MSSTYSTTRKRGSLDTPNRRKIPHELLGDQLLMTISSSEVWPRETRQKRFLDAYMDDVRRLLHFSTSYTCRQEM